MKIIKKIYLSFFFLIFYLFKVIQANIFIAYDILTPSLRAKPEFIWIPIKVTSDFGILLLSNLITMTPGTLTVEITPDKKNLLVHCLYYMEGDKVHQEINSIQSKILQLTT